MNVMKELIPKPFMRTVNKQNLGWSEIRIIKAIPDPDPVKVMIRVSDVWTNLFELRLLLLKKSCNSKRRVGREVNHRKSKVRNFCWSSTPIQLQLYSIFISINEANEMKYLEKCIGGATINKVWITDYEDEKIMRTASIILRGLKIGEICANHQPPPINIV